MAACCLFGTVGGALEWWPRGFLSRGMGFLKHLLLSLRPQRTQQEWGQGMCSPEGESQLSACPCHDDREEWQVTVTPTSLGEPGGPRRTAMHWAWCVNGESMPAFCSAAECSVQRVLPMWVLVPWVFFLPQLRVGNRDLADTGWFVFPSPCFKIPPAVVLAKQQTTQILPGQRPPALGKLPAEGAPLPPFPFPSLGTSNVCYQNFLTFISFPTFKPRYSHSILGVLLQN